MLLRQTVLNIPLSQGCDFIAFYFHHRPILFPARMRISDSQMRHKWVH